MQRRYLILAVLTAFTIVAAAYGGLMSFRLSQLPFSIQFVDAGTAVISPIKGIALPAGIIAGDRMDLAATPETTRVTFNALNLPLDQHYDIVVRRPAGLVTASVTSVDMASASGFPFIEWASCLQILLTAGIALLTLWRGRDRAAAAMAFWAMALIAGDACSHVPAPAGTAGLIVCVVYNGCYLLGRVGFYVMADTIASRFLGPKMRAAFLAAFLLLLTAGASLFSIGALLRMILAGSAATFLPGYGMLWTASYLLPVILLFTSYRHADAKGQLRLRWMLWSCVAFTACVLVGDTLPFGYIGSNIFFNAALVTSLAGFMYAVLRHRVVDVSVVLDRTLVYGGMTTLVVGVLAAVNSLVQHAALGTGASLVLQITVPLALGIVLGKVRTYLDFAVERVFFRSRYRAEKALKAFGRHCGHIEGIPELLEATVTTLRRHTRSPGVAFYAAGRRV